MEGVVAVGGLRETVGDDVTPRDVLDEELEDTLAAERARRPKGAGVRHWERCRAMAYSSGNRCPFRITEGVLCGKHNKFGAVIPDDWTQPDNLPVWRYAAR